MNIHPPESYIYMRSGRAVHPGTMEADDVHLSDIAAGLAGQRRFVGHSDVSVALHSVAVYDVATVLELSRRELRWALFHDAAEAYFGDVAKPLQKYLCDSWREDYRRLEEIIRDKYGCKFSKWVKMIDQAIVVAEMELSGMAYPSNGPAYKVPVFPLLHDVCTDVYAMLKRRDYPDDQLFLRAAREVLTEGGPND